MFRGKVIQISKKEPIFISRSSRFFHCKRNISFSTLGLYAVLPLLEF
jgi:hypothetical protein